MEEELGIALFHRHPKGVDSLTEAGVELRSEAARLLEDFSATRSRMQAFVRGRARQHRRGLPPVRRRRIRSRPRCCA